MVDNSNGLWWRHQMETFSALLVLCAGNSPITGESLPPPPPPPPTPHPHPPPPTHTNGSDAELLWFLWSAPWINSWINNREARDLRHQRTHYHVIVMLGKCRIDCTWGCNTVIFNILPLMSIKLHIVALQCMSVCINDSWINHQSWRTLTYLLWTLGPVSI